MSDIKLGSIITGDAARDAIHIALAPVIAKQRLCPAEHVGLNAEGKADRNAHPKVGIVDPFLADDVPQDARFWLCLYQQTVTGMRHEWSHPAFKDAVAAPACGDSAIIERSRQWIRDYAEQLGRENGEVSYDELIEACETGSHCFGQNIDVYEPDPALAIHYAVITGKPAKEVHFRCAC